MEIEKTTRESLIKLHQMIMDATASGNPICTDPIPFLSLSGRKTSIIVQSVTPSDSDNPLFDFALYDASKGRIGIIHNVNSSFDIDDPHSVSRAIATFTIQIVDIRFLASVAGSEDFRSMLFPDDELENILRTALTRVYTVAEGGPFEFIKHIL